MPPLMISIVMPIAPMATITVCASTMRKLKGERNRPGASINTTKMRITTARPTNGPRRANQRHYQPGA